MKLINLNQENKFSGILLKVIYKLEAADSEHSPKKETRYSIIQLLIKYRPFHMVLDLVGTLIVHLEIHELSMQNCKICSNNSTYNMKM